MPTPPDCCTSWTSWKTAALGLVLGVAVVALMPASSLFVRTDGDARSAETGERWACPMMDFIGTRPGACPVCGMTLQRVTAGEIQRVQAQRMGVQLATVVSGPARVTVRAAGIADYDHRFTRLVIPRVAGRIMKRYQATYGCCQEIAAGDPVLDLYSPEVFQAQGELQAALKLGNTALAASLDERFARWNLAPVAAAIRAGGAPTDTVTITAPFAGQVLLREFAMVDEALMVGKEITADLPLLRLVDPDRMVITVQVPELRAAFLREGQSVDLSSDDGGDLRSLHATIARVANEINPEIRSVEVRIHLTGARGVLKPGSLVTARIHSVLGPDLRPADPRTPATWGQFVLVPKDAVLSTGVRHVAWRLTGKTAEGSQQFAIAPLDLGPRLEDDDGNDRYVVRLGLAAGDQVAAQGAFLIDAQAQLAGSKSLLYPTGAAKVDAGHAH